MRRPLAPQTAIGLRRRQTPTGPALVAVIAHALELPAGSRLTLRRLHEGDGDAPDFVLVVDRLARLTAAEQRQAEADDLSRSAWRRDPRDHDEGHP